MKMKKIIAAALIAALALPCGNAGAAKAKPGAFSPASPLAHSMEDEFTNGDYRYRISSGETAVITRYMGSGSNIEIPAELDGRTVTSVAARAFKNLDAEEIAIPETVQTLEGLSFYYMTSISRVRVRGKRTLIADDAFRFPAAITFVCASDSRAYAFAKEMRASVSLTDGIDLADAKIALEHGQVVQSDDFDGMAVTVTLNGRVLDEKVDYVCKWPPLKELRAVGTKTVVISAADYNANRYTGSASAQFDVIPRAPARMSAGRNVTASSVPLRWTAAEGADGYLLFRRKGASGQYRRICALQGAGASSYTDAGLDRDSRYQYRLIAIKEAGGKSYRSNPTDLTVYTDSGKKVAKSPKKAKMKTRKIKLKAKAFTENYDGNWAQPSAVSDFFDAQGRYTVAYGDRSHVYIHVLDNKSLTIKKTIRIKKKYGLLGSVAGGPDGNYYVVWGQTGRKTGSVVLSVAKYDKNGKFIKSCDKRNTGAAKDSMTPFVGGNCAVAFQNGALICYYARQMNDTHQSSDAFCVNIDDMTPNEDYESRVSHSFDQRVTALSNGGVLFTDLGDAGPRGFRLYESGPAHEWKADPFHFYGPSGDNWIYAKLGGACETSTGVALVGTSAPSMTKKFKKEDERLFLQVIDPVTGSSVLKGKTRKGTAGGSPYTDEGVKWLTGRKDGEVIASNVAVMEKGRILVMWETGNDRYKDEIESWYMVLSASGKTLQKKTKIGRARLNECEEVKYKNGCAYWTTADGAREAVVHKLCVGK